MKTKTWILGGLAVAGGVALLAWAFAPRPLEVETGVADRGPFETVITEEGRTTLRQRFTVSAPLTGRLARITLEAGDTPTFRVNVENTGTQDGTGVTVVARGGSGGSGGSGGRGGEGSKPGGTGGPGGPGGDGAPGGDGGHVVLVLDDRYPELAKIVGIDVSGGMGGGAGMGGSGGRGAPAYTPCSGCKMIAAGNNGPGGPSGRSSSADGRAGTAEVRRGDISELFPGLPPGVRMRDDPRPEPEPEPEPEPKGKGKGRGKGSKK